MKTSLVFLGLVAATLSCSSESATPDVAGTYTLNLTNTKLDCAMVPNAAVGEQTTGVEVVIAQDATNKKQVTATVGGVAGVFLGLTLGSATFTGTVSGNALTMALEGKSRLTAGSCAYNQVATLNATVDKDILTGTITYTYATNKASDCGIKDTCQDQQAVNGSRPPSVH